MRVAMEKDQKQFEEEGEFSDDILSDSEDDEYGFGESVPQEEELVAADGEETVEKREEEDGSTLHPSAPLSRICLNDNKAGMEGLDKAKINQIIMEASRGSKYYENELRKERQVQNRVQQMLVDLEKVTPTQRLGALKAADKELESLETTRDLNHIIVHIDMDAFYASVEIRDNPALRDIPMAVGSKYMLSTSNYHARRFGVRAAMPGFIGKKLCPKLVIVPTRFDKYHEASEQVREILRLYDHNFSPVGLDEAYLDLTNFVMKQISGELADNSTEFNSTTSNTSCGFEDCLTPDHWRYAEEVVEKMRREIQERTQLTASAGLAPNMMLAKVASDINKPNGQFTVTPTREGVLEFVHKLPIRKVSGIGKVTESMLNALNVTTCGDLHRERAVLQLLFSPSSSSHFLSVSLGLGSTHVHREYVRKSMSNQRTFPEMSQVEELQGKCLELCQELATDMKRHSISGRTVTMKVKTVEFEVRTKAVTLPKAVSTAEELYSAASELLTAEIQVVHPSPLRLRLMGVRISSLDSGEDDDSGQIRGRRGKQETLDLFVRQQPPSSSSSTTVALLGGSAITTPQPSPSSTITTSQSLPGSITTSSSVSRHVESHVDGKAIENEDEEEEERVKCPICGKRLDKTKPHDINSHIDECLNLPVIASLIGTSSSTVTTSHTLLHPHTNTKESPTKTKSASTTDSPHKLRGRGNNSRERGGKAPGQRKRSLDSGNSAAKKRKTLDEFWT